MFKALLSELHRKTQCLEQTGEGLLFKNMKYKSSASIGLRSSHMLFNIWVCYTGTSIIIIRRRDLAPAWLNSIRQRNMLEFYSASDKTLKLSKTTSLYIFIGGDFTRCTFAFLERLVLPVLLCTTFIYRSKK